MPVIIGVDPHKATHIPVAIDSSEAELARARVRATRKQAQQLLRWAEPLGKRTWAVESAGGLGYLLSQQLVAAGETVLDVPPTLAARIRVLGSGRSDKNDPDDALSVAVAALRTPALREVVAADHAQVLRLLAKRNIDIGSHCTRVVCRLDNVLMELVSGGIAKELNASDAVAVLERIEPTTPIELARRDMALEILADVQRLDAQLKQSHRRIRTAVAASQTTVTELFGVGPVLACYLVGFTGDITRFATRDAYAAYNGTAPVERSSGGRAPGLPARQPAPQPRPAPRSDLPDSPASFRRAHVLRAQARRRQDQEGRHPLTEAPHQQRRLPQARRGPAPSRLGGPGRALRNVSVVQRGRLPSCTPALRTKPLPGPTSNCTPADRGPLPRAPDTSKSQLDSKRIR
jgi:transposase